MTRLLFYWYNSAVETHRLLSSFIRLCRWCTVKKTVADHPARAERKAKYVASREIIPREVIHITLTFTFAVLGAIGSIASIVSLVLYVHDRKKEVSRLLQQNGSWMFEG